jgi:dolichol-phosphate mannosyltransferase
VSEQPRISIVIPAYNEDDAIIGVLDRMFESVRLSSEVLVVVDSEDDSTVPVVVEYAQKEPRLRYLVNTYGRGPANAIRFGIDSSAASVAVVTMADGCDDPRQIDDLARLVERGVGIDSRDGFEIGIELTAKAKRMRLPVSPGGYPSICAGTASPSAPA